MTVLGHWITILALVTSGCSLVGYVRLALGLQAGILRPRVFLLLSALSIAAASAVLLFLLLNHDYSNGYVFSYSDRSLPWHFLVSSFYAGQEGSFLFWALCSAFLGVLLSQSTRKRGNEAWVMVVFMVIQTSMILLVLAKSPFVSLWEMFPQVQVGQVPLDGRGLNPLLQNFWMVVHPPILFLGFAGMAVPFSLAMGGMWKGDFTVLARQGFPWILFASLVLGLGIMLGAYWAYGVLGWGGYWGWDPVENSSLVPWLTSIGLLHTMLAQRRTGKYARTNVALASVTFFLVMYSTFLTRSGILGNASVHSFSDPGAAVYWLLLAVLGVIAGSSLMMLAVRWRAMGVGSRESDTMIFTRESALGAGAIVLGLSAAVVLFGTSLPIFSTTRVEPSFYDATNLPIAIAIVSLIGFSLYTQWETQDFREILGKNARGATGAIAAGVLAYLSGVRDIPLLILTIASFFAIIVNVEIAVRVAKGNWRSMGGKLGHAGIALFFLGVIATGRYSTTERLALTLNVPQQALGKTFTFTSVAPREDGKTTFVVKAGDGVSTSTLQPVMFSAGDQGVMKNPDIVSSLTHDLYLSPLAYDEPSNAGMEYRIAKGEEVAAGEARVKFVQFQIEGEHEAMMQSMNRTMRIGALLEIRKGMAMESLTATAIVRPGKAQEFPPVQSSLLNSTVRLGGMSIGDGASPSIMLSVEPGGRVGSSGVLIVEASMKPFILLLWCGTVIMFLGFSLALAQRTKEGKA